MTSSSSRATILNRLRASRPFADAVPRPTDYLDVTQQADAAPAALLERFTAELTRLSGEIFVTADEDAARACVRDLLAGHAATHVLAWEFAHIPLPGLADDLRAANIRVTVPGVHDEFHAETLADAGSAQVGITGVDAAAATTGTLIVTSGPGRGRLPTILPPVHLVIMRQAQIVPRIESWIAAQRADNLAGLRGAANAAFITGPSRTGDIEMELILGVHGPGRVQVVVIP